MLSLLGAAAAAAALRAAAQPGLDAIRPAALSAHVRFLADDALEGRGSGSRGHAVAARYVAAQFEALGVSPAGEHGGWFQEVPMRALRYDPAKSGLSVSAGGRTRTFTVDEEVLLRPSVLTPDAEREGDLVFVGYAVSAPPYGYDDANADLTGKIVILLPGAPRSFDPAARAVFSDTDRKARILAARGAVAMIAVATPEFASYAPWDAMRTVGRLEQMGQVDGSRVTSGIPIPAALLSMDGLDEILEMAGATVTAKALVEETEAGRARPRSLAARARLAARSSSVRDVTSENVIGILRGSDPALAAEAVVLSAHVDGFGIGPEVNGDAIYNGAEDDATGVAAVLEIARAFAALPRRPRRSVVFFLATGEEKGLVGSLFFADHPTAGVRIVADVNVDAAPGRWTPHDMIVRGVEHSSLAGPAARAAEALGLALSPDPEPEKNYFLRSDQYSFVRAGIPAVCPGPGYRDEKGDEAANRANHAAFFRTRYHKPSDEWGAPRDWSAVAAEARYHLLLGLEIAQEDARPAWNAGDVFARLFPTR